MKTFKLIDFWGQVMLISASLLCILVRVEVAFMGYFIVGGWQVISCLLHLAFEGQFFSVNDRRYYNKTLLWTLIIGVLSIPIWIVFGFVLLFVSPFLAIWYASICYGENRLLAHKSLVHLK